MLYSLLTFIFLTAPADAANSPFCEPKARASFLLDEIQAMTHQEILETIKSPNSHQNFKVTFKKGAHLQNEKVLVVAQTEIPHTVELRGFDEKTRKMRVAIVNESTGELAKEFDVAFDDIIKVEVQPRRIPKSKRNPTTRIDADKKVSSEYPRTPPKVRPINAKFSKEALNGLVVIEERNARSMNKTFIVMDPKTRKKYLYKPDSGVGKDIVEVTGDPVKVTNSSVTISDIAQKLGFKSISEARIGFVEGHGRGVIVEWVDNVVGIDSLYIDLKRTHAKIKNIESRLEDSPPALRASYEEERKRLRVELAQTDRKIQKIIKSPEYQQAYYENLILDYLTGNYDHLGQTGLKFEGGLLVEGGMIYPDPYSSRNFLVNTGHETNGVSMVRGIDHDLAFNSGNPHVAQHYIERTPAIEIQRAESSLTSPGVFPYPSLDGVSSALDAALTHPDLQPALNHLFSSQNAWTDFLRQRAISEEDIAFWRENLQHLRERRDALRR